MALDRPWFFQVTAELQRMPIDKSASQRVVMSHLPAPEIGNHGIEGGDLFAADVSSSQDVFGYGWRECSQFQQLTECSRQHIFPTTYKTTPTTEGWRSAVTSPWMWLHAGGSRSTQATKGRKQDSNTHATTEPVRGTLTVGRSVVRCVSTLWSKVRLPNCQARPELRVSLSSKIRLRCHC